MKLNMEQFLLDIKNKSPYNTKINNRKIYNYPEIIVLFDYISILKKYCEFLEKRIKKLEEKND